MFSKILPPTDETTEDRREAPTAGHPRRLHQSGRTVAQTIGVFSRVYGGGRRTRPGSGEARGRLARFEPRRAASSSCFR
jgi:hypothetical protein